MSYQKEFINPEILESYLPADDYCVVNEDDPSLHPIYIKMPACPPIETIDGYGKHAIDQKFIKQVMPERLVNVVNSFDTIDEVWEELEENAAIYQDEIRWIKIQQYRRFNGYWCFIYGKPTYFDGWNYVYLNFWYFMDGGLPDFRDRNRKYFHAMRYAYTASDVPLYDENNVLLYEDRLINGQMKQVPVSKDVGSRVLFGILYPKNRRDGATNMCLCASYLETTSRTGVISGIVSMTGPKAKEHFDKILKPGWLGMPFFFKPVHDGFDNPEKDIKFFRPKKKGGKAKAIKQLGSIMNYSETAQSTFYDGDKVFWLLNDECGKTLEANVDARHKVLRNCVSQGNGSVIGGFMPYPSTVGEMKGEGGKNFFNLSLKSHWNQRSALTGQTVSGLINVFFKSEEGLEGFVDPYGNSVVEEPTAFQIKLAQREPGWEKKYVYASRGIGARQYLEDARKQYLDAGDLDNYNREVRLFPQWFSEAFRTEDGDSGFNTVKLNNRIEELKYTFKKECRRGNFEWENNIQDGKVIWKDHPEGRWYLSKILTDNESNQKYKDNGIWYPYNPKFTASADPFKQNNKTKGRGMSDGGGAIFWDYDESIDGQADINYWKTHRFVCSYRNRPLERDTGYCEDMLMMSVYFGAMMYPEINVTAVWDHFDQRGYAGYLKYDIEVRTGQFKATPGFTSTDATKQDLFSGVRDYIEKHVHREKHLDILMECKNIPGIDDMTHWDLFTAGAGAIRGSKSKHAQLMKVNTEKVNINAYLERHYN